ncbi:Pls/PosA family non-ribosomal peptide synthetase [Actinacidiphila oryziradicis]|uniref:Amino acid adenylation domain-containing protein n=1 Tax=Actinacidiphila oryziradicis TaxID=2571141 RepID=A0A4U0SEW1_9ACTN|nr:Pls/PosA family non-ribosomal peptide synthetase [Actinacidiphila oryziradicis]TKA08094.1 amino acid adenylation domain-containing protein [Actinacidiphila oryziradicis]
MRVIPSGTLPIGAGKRLHHFFESTCDRTPAATALECEQHALTYAELDARANQLARYLRGLGIGQGAGVAILLPRSVDMYVSLLGVGKAGAAFVPIDPASPPGRATYIAADAGVDAVLTTSGLMSGVEGLSCRVIELDSCIRELARLPTTRPPPDASAPGWGDGDPLAYVMYTSGSSGRPKGVQIAQSSICNFLDVISGIYDVQPHDRVYQGMTISFDFSIEEIWPTWSVGAIVVAGPPGSGWLGAELGDFLEDREITMLYCVPTLLETIPQELPHIRSVVVGGETCPGPLVERWSRPGRRMLNTYGPTETTVTATWGELLPGRAVTIGKPLPTYSVVLLDERRRPVPDGAVGEICVGGPGVARGYVERPELTADRFIEHPLAPRSSRLYRTGDLGRMTADGQIEFLGRADTQVKIRGYRVDLGEIDNVLLEDPGVAEAVTAVVAGPEADGGSGELSAYVVPAPGGTNDSEELVTRLHGHLRRKLPAYMVPSFLDILPQLPALPSGKVDRKRLPAPTRRLRAAGGRVVAAQGELETRIRDTWAEVLGIEPETLSAEADFFTDLGGHSLLAAKTVSLLRGRGIGASPALRDLYANPTVARLAALLRAPARTARSAAPPRPEPIRHSSGRIAAAGVAQGGTIYLLLLALTLPVSFVYSRHGGRIEAQSSVQLMISAFAGYLVVRWIVPVVLVRPLTAGIRPGRYRLWGWVYLRLWAVNLLLSVSPLPVLSGSPMMAVYLRLLGARIGPRTTIATSMVNLPTMLRIGGDASVGYGVSLRPWLVGDGWVTVAPIEIGPHAFVGANAVLDPGARMGARAGLGEQSVIGQDDEAVPAGARWAGSPPCPIDALAPGVETMLRAHRSADRWRPRHLAAALLGLAFLEITELMMILPSVALFWWASLSWGIVGGIAATTLSGPVYVLTVCCVVAVGKRLILPKVPIGIRPVRSSLGVRKWVTDKLLEFSLTFTNSLYATLYAVPWLRLLGARVGRGAEVATAAHLDPNLLTLGDGSFVADLASVGAATYAAGHVAFGPTEVGRRAFVGNASFIPAGTQMGPGSLVGVGTVPPQDGVPDGTSWLGSPAIRLPVRQSSGSFPEERTFRPTRKAVLQRLGTEFFRTTMPASVLALSAYLYLLALSGLAHSRGLLAPVLMSPVLAMGTGLAVIVYCAVVKRLVVGTYRPRVEPLWSWFVRRTEFVTGLYEAAAVPAGVGFLVGTPFLPLVLRGFGARIGRGTWIGTTFLTEFDLVVVGDDAAVGMGVSLQTHLFEDRVMKMSVVTVQVGASVGTRAVVLYDAVVGERVRLGALSLLMKGERLTPGTSWRGIPAEGVANQRADEPLPLSRHR